MSEQRPDLTIVIAARDEEVALPQLIEALRRNLDAIALSAEVIIVDDESSDSTPKILARATEQDARFRWIRLPQRGGQTGCYRAAFAEARGRYILRMDGDMQDHPDDLPLFADKIRDGCQIVVGLREVRKHALAFRIASRVFDLLMLVAFDSPFHEHSVSFAAFDADFLRHIQLKDGDHRFLVPIAWSKRPDKVGEVVVRHGERVGGQSKYRMATKFAGGLKQLVGVMWRLQQGYYDK